MNEFINIFLVLYALVFISFSIVSFLDYKSDTIFRDKINTFKESLAQSPREFWATIVIVLAIASLVMTIIGIAAFSFAATIGILVGNIL